MNVPGIDFTITVSEVTPEGVFPNGKDTLLSARVVFSPSRQSGSRSMQPERRWERVFFVESDGVAMLYGVDEQEGIPQGFHTELAFKQQAFVKELRRLTNLSVLSGDLPESLGKGRYCWAEASVTAAFAVRRGLGMDIMVGYRHPDLHDFVIERLDRDLYGFLKRAMAVQYATC